MNKPIRTTLIFGFLSALCFIPLSSIPHYWHWQITYKLLILITLALYSVLLCRWSRTPLVSHPFRFPVADPGCLQLDSQRYLF